MTELEYMREAGKMAAKVLDFIGPYVQPGITTLELNDLCHTFHEENGIIPAPLNYKGFPKSVCISVNHVVCHGIPSDKKLNEGDIVNIDVTPIVNGWHGDSSRMFFVGQPNRKAERLVEVCHDAMMHGIEQVKPGNYTGDIGHAIETYAKKYKYGVVTEYCGHGIGQKFHTAPQVPGVGKPGTGTKLEEGMFITVEPMLNIGKPGTKVLADGWTVVTKDRTLSAQWEHTIAVVENGYEILTLSD